MSDNPRDIMAQARAMAEAHLPAIARELLDWSNTGLLTDGWFRQVAVVLAPLSSHHDPLGMAERVVRRVMLEKIAR